MFESIKSMFSKAQEAVHIDRKKLAKRKAMRRLRKIRGKNAPEKLDSAVKEFMEDYFGIKDAVTLEEMNKICGKKKIRKDIKEKIKRFCENFETAKFKDGEITHEEISLLAGEFRQVLHEL